MKTSRLSTTSSVSTPKTSPSTGNINNAVESRLFQTVKVDTSPLDFDNEKELQKKLEEIVADFKNKEKDWSVRLKQLQLLQRIINGNGIECKGWSVLLRMISPSLIEQLTELRSTIVKEACQCVSLLGIRMKLKFEPFALQYTHALIRMVPVKTTIISESAHQTLKDILENVPTKSLLQMFIDSSFDQHNEQLRKRASEYIYIVLNRAILNEGMLLVSCIPALERSIHKLLTDGGSETRQIARYCFWAYSELNEKGATTLFYQQLSPTTQKNLFTVYQHLEGDQLEICDKLKRALFEEEQEQKLVEDSTDLDFDLNDFKKDSGNNNGSSGAGDSNATRSKTPTGRSSGLKSRLPISTNSSSTKTTISSLATTGSRSGSSLNNRDSSGIGGVGSSIKKPIDHNMMRSKSSLGTTRKDTITGTPSTTGSSMTSNINSSPISKTPTTTTVKTTSSSSPNLATSTQSGRYSSIGTRVITSPLSKQTSSSNLTRSLPPINKSVSAPMPMPTPPTLTKSKSTPTSPISNSTNTTTTTTTTTSTTPMKKLSSSTNSSPSVTNPTSSLKKPSGISSPSTKLSSSTTTTTTPRSSLKAPSSLTSTSTTPSTTPAKKSFITKSTPDDKPTSITTKTKTTTTTNNIEKRKSTNIVDEMDLESLEISLNQDNKLAFQEISDEITNNLIDAKKGLSFYELTLDDLETTNNGNGNGSSSNSSSKRSSSSIKESTTADLEFNWLEDSVHDSLIEDDVLDFNDENNNSTFIPRNLNNKIHQKIDEEEEPYNEEDDDELMF